VQSKHPNAKAWLGKSMFKYRKAGQTCFLDEQSRMHMDICDLVSNVFYEGKLIIAADAEASLTWRAERAVSEVEPLGRKNVFLYRCLEEGIFYPAYGGPVRFSSADLISGLVRRLLMTLAADQIAVLCPYRAQRTVIKNNLRRNGIRDVKVSTVHRAQGTECHTVIFDPVIANNDFLRDPEIGPRLINVAVSRAMARLVVVVSVGDRNNEWIGRIANVIESGPTDQAIQLGSIVFDTRFPGAFVGTVVRYNNIVARIERDVGDAFEVLDCKTGKTRTFKTAFVRENCRRAAAASAPS